MMVEEFHRKLNALKLLAASSEECAPGIQPKQLD